GRRDASGVVSRAGIQRLRVPAWPARGRNSWAAADGSSASLCRARTTGPVCWDARDLRGRAADHVRGEWLSVPFAGRSVPVEGPGAVRGGCNDHRSRAGPVPGTPGCPYPPRPHRLEAPPRSDNLHSVITDRFVADSTTTVNHFAQIGHERNDLV